jgi:hypothetical protein
MLTGLLIMRHDSRRGMCGQKPGHGARKPVSTPHRVRSECADFCEDPWCHILPLNQPGGKLTEAEQGLKYLADQLSCGRGCLLGMMKVTHALYWLRLYFAGKKTGNHSAAGRRLKDGLPTPTT